MAGLKNHPGLWLADPAAAAWDRMEDAHGVIRINSAGRTEAEQQNLINRWHKGGTYNRPPYLYRPAEPANTSSHVRAGGIAIDTPDIGKLLARADYGFTQTHPNSDPVHFEYVQVNDRHIPGNVQPTPPAVPSKIPAGLRWYGIQEMLKDNDGYRGAIDNIPGPQTVSAFQHFLNRSGYDAGLQDAIWGERTGKAGQRWLKARWGYAGAIDNDYGPGTRAAWQRAETANWHAFH
jgi:hypothetical protein